MYGALFFGGQEQSSKKVNRLAQKGVVVPGEAPRSPNLPNMQRQESTDAVHGGRSEHHRNPHHAKPAVCRGDIQNSLCGERQQIKSPAALMPHLDTLGSSTVPWEFR